MAQKNLLTRFICLRPVWSTLIAAILGGLVLGLLFMPLMISGIHDIRDLFGLLGIYSLLGIFFIAPLLMTAYNICYLVIRTQTAPVQKAGRRMEYAAIVFGAFCSFLWGAISNINWYNDWPEQLYNDGLHTPIATWTMPTVITLSVIAFMGYLILRVRRTSTLPPLLATLSIGAMYLGGTLCIIWCLQIAAHDLLLCLYPANLLLIGAKVIKEMVVSRKGEEHPEPQGKSKLILSFHHLLSRAENWPWLGILLALPLLGLTIAILTLFGQTPDSIIQAWTQTSDWTLSQQIAPQNIYVDQHYLCTVAAGGHPKVVKPLREGRRHGHKVLVNRQLCIANAFEQLLEERLPRTHRAIRSFYDKCGYPIAKHIKSPYMADAIWFLMKPLEWFFLTVLYLCDPKPENRIAVQYPHAPLPKQQ